MQRTEFIILKEDERQAREVNCFEKRLCESVREILLRERRERAYEAYKYMYIVVEINVSSDLYLETIL